MPSENEMGRKIRELHGSLLDSTVEEPIFKDYTKVLTQAKRYEMGTYDPPQNCQKLAIKYCNEEIWNGKFERGKKLLIRVA